jgi:hypothetical protein
MTVGGSFNADEIKSKVTGGGRKLPIRPSRKGRFNEKRPAVLVARFCPTTFSRNLFPIALSRNCPSKMEKWDCGKRVDTKVKKGQP